MSTQQQTSVQNFLNENFKSLDQQYTNIANNVVDIAKSHKAPATEKSR